MNANKMDATKWMPNNGCQTVDAWMSKKRFVKTKYDIKLIIKLFISIIFLIFPIFDFHKMNNFFPI